MRSNQRAVTLDNRHASVQKAVMSICKACGLEVNWTKSGRKWSCSNPDGSDHWDLCSQTKFARIKRTGEYFEIGKTQGYLTVFKPSGVQLVQESSGRIRGAHYKPSGDCADCCAPWGICAQPCPDAITSKQFHKPTERK